MSTRIKQALLAVVGAAVFLTMIGLGLWQMRVFEDKENESAALRAQQPPVPLLSNVNPDGSVGDVYGKQVTVSGRFLPDQQVLVVAADGSVRVVTAFQPSDQRVLPVVRGSVASVGAAIPPPPEGPVDLVGVFLPSEAAETSLSVPAGSLGSVRLPALAQEWPQQLFPGFVTLSPEDSAAAGLGGASVSLPSGDQSFRNLGYALQWWVFAAFGAFMIIRLIKAVGRTGDLGTLADQEDT